MLIVDADEAATPELAQELKALLASNPAHVAYRVPFKNLLPEAWGTGGYFWTSQKRLLKRGAVRWSDSQWVHVPAEHEGKAGRLRHGLIHRPFDSLSHLIRKQVSYGTSGAQHFHAVGRHSSLLRTWVHTAGAFLKYYVFKGLFRFGVGGFAAASGLALNVLLKYSLLWELENSRGPIPERAAVPGANP